VHAPEVHEQVPAPGAVLKSTEELLVADAPAVDAPAADAPAADAPVADAPVADAPVADAPVADAPVADAPVADAPVADAPVADAPAADVAEQVQGPLPPAPADPAGMIPAELFPPSWAEVIGTTLRLWLQRRVLRRLPGWSGLSSSRRQQVRAAFAVIVILAAGALSIQLSGGFAAKPARAARASGSAPSAGAAALSPAAADLQHAASWVAAQVDRSAIVACDSTMCAALANDGFPGADLMPLTSASTDPLGSAIVVSTEAVRSQFGRILPAVYAPAILASFGTGTAGVQVRVMAPDGAAAYRHGLSADIAARRATGAQLLRNTRLQVSGQARTELATGQVDTRMLTTLVNLTAQYQVRVLAFGDAGPGASPGIPLRFAEIAVGPLAGQPVSTPLLPAVLLYLRTSLPPFRAAGIQVARTSASQSVLRIEFAAPSPFGLLSQLAAK